MKGCNGCVCDTDRCSCPYKIRVEKRNFLDFSDRVMGMVWLAEVTHPTIYGVLHSGFYAWTKQGAIKKARRFIAEWDKAPEEEIIEVPRGNA